MRQDVVVTASPPVAAVARPAPGAVLDAVLERITYANEETGYTIARVATDRSGTDLLTVVGSLLGVQPGESLRLVGRWGSHPKYGRQFEVHSFTTVLPATIQGIERYLGSGLIKGIGPKMAARIVAHFGADTLRIIEDEPARLVEVPGLGPKRTAMIGRASGCPRRWRCASTRSTATRRSQLSATSRTGWPPTCGASVSRPPTPSRRPSVSRTTARIGSWPASSKPCPRPPTTATATCPNPP